MAYSFNSTTVRVVNGECGWQVEVASGKCEWHVTSARGGWHVKQRGPYCFFHAPHGTRTGHFVSMRRAFTLLELLAVVVLLGILAAVIVPRIGASTDKAKINICLQIRADLNAAIERYRLDTGSLPSSMSVLENSEYYPERIPPCPYDQTTYELDSTTGRIAGHQHGK